MYQKTLNLVTGEEGSCIKRLSDNVLIPFNKENADYQQYLKWLDEGNTPIPSDKNVIETINHTSK